MDRPWQTLACCCQMTRTSLYSIRIRLHHGGGFAMGPGKADLLEAIQAAGSVAAAGRELGLSYWKTRRLLDEMNQSFRAPLVATSRGGKDGGGARLTGTGVQVLARFRAMEAAAGSAVGPMVESFQGFLRD